MKSEFDESGRKEEKMTDSFPNMVFVLFIVKMTFRS